jgi:prophage DNA circulation protein
VSGILGAASAALSAPLGQANALGARALNLLDPTWRQASLRGLPFWVPAATDSLGRRWVTHEFPGRDDPWHEDLGERTRALDVEGLLIGDDVLLQVEEFRAAIAAPGAARFTHPWFGELEVVVLDGSVTLSETQQRLARLSLRLERAGRRPAPLVGQDGLAGVLDRVDALRLATLRTLGRLRQLIALPRQLQSALGVFVGSAAAQLTQLQVAFGRPFDRQGNPAGQGLAQLGAAQLLPATLGPALLDACRGLTVLVVPPRPGEAPAREGLWPVGPPLAPGACWPALAGFVAPRLAMGQEVLSPWAASLTAGVAAECARALAYTPFDVRADAIAARDRVAETLAAAADALLLAGMEECRAEAVAVRAALIADTSARAARLPALRRLTLPRSLPATLVAYRLDGDAEATLFDRAAALAARNRVRHPLFVPGQVALEVRR